MATEIVIVNVDKTETTYASVDDMPEGALKEEMKQMVAHNPKTIKIRKILR